MALDDVELVDETTQCRQHGDDVLVAWRVVFLTVFITACVTLLVAKRLHCTHDGTNPAGRTLLRLSATQRGTSPPTQKGSNRKGTVVLLKSSSDPFFPFQASALAGSDDEDFVLRSEHPPLVGAGVKESVKGGHGSGGGALSMARGSVNAELLSSRGLLRDTPLGRASGRDGWSNKDASGTDYATPRTSRAPSRTPSWSATAAQASKTAFGSSHKLGAYRPSPMVGRDSVSSAAARTSRAAGKGAVVYSSSLFMRSGSGDLFHPPGVGHSWPA